MDNFNLSNTTEPSCPSCDEDIAERLMLNFREALTRCHDQRCDCPCHRD